ncbi:hypothetical protein [Peribacillus sp. SCS-155]|uniref:hypothetical protein n=1 Tax=Peribacillus sedimenti TaxID=3115297 RepID=UPI003906587F
MRRELFAVLNDKSTLFFTRYNDVDCIITDKYYSEFTLGEVKQFQELGREAVTRNDGDGQGIGGR